MGGYLRLNLRVCVVDDYTARRFSNFINEFLRENEKVRETFKPVYLGPRYRLLSKKIEVENLVTLSL